MSDEKFSNLPGQSFKVPDSIKKLTEDSSLSKLMKKIESISALKSFEAPRLNVPSFDVEALRPPSQKELNNYQSAGVLMRSLATSISEWRKQLPEGVQPAVLALLNGGVQIEVTSLAQESFHGIRVEGSINGAPCIVLAHQSTLQLLCYLQPINPPEVPKRTIGFIINGEQSEA